MKRFILTGLLLLGISQVPSFAQSNRSNDDIYTTGSDARNAKEDDDASRNRQRYQTEESYDDSPTYNSTSGSYADSDGSGDYKNYARSYDNDGYVDYDDDYYYSTRINRFNRPFYNMGYWSSFYNPYWYDPFWVDPYWGWSWWSRPGFSVSFGWGQPYWSSYWGWHTWYGYGGFNSCWSYPYYAGGWGGGYWGGYGSYYNGFWNGYYAGMYNGGGYYQPRTVTYGPRVAMNSSYGGRTMQLNGGIRQQSPGTQPYGPRTGTRRETINSPGQIDTRNSAIPVDRGNLGSDTRVISRDRPNRGNLNMQSGDNNIRNNDDQVASPARGNVERPRRGWFENDTRSGDNNVRPQQSGGYERPSYGQPERQQPRTIEQPRYEQRNMQPQQPRYEQPRYEQPRYEQPRMSTPRMESPRMEAPRSMPGGSGGGGGRTFGGRR